MSAIRETLYRASENLGSKRFLQSILQKIDTPEKLVRFIHCYTVFNGDFAGGVANLAGEFHIRGDIFQGDSPISALNDKGSEIATEIYYAAEDEYADRGSNLRVTHRQLAQVLLAATLDYFHTDAITDSLTVETRNAISQVREGYCLNKTSSEDDLLQGLGFHIGSELLADQEFNLIDAFLRDRYPELVTFLETTKSPYGDIPAYHWIALHTIVEVEHLDHAFVAAERVVNYYKGQKSVAEVEALILKGFTRFGELQKTFFGAILT